MARKFDVAIIGGGILGTGLAYWLSRLFEGRIALLEMESDVAVHTSGRNTGVIHRPFYLNPERRRIFALSAQVSYHLWKKYAAQKGLPWKEIGTIEVAVEPHEVKIIEKYMHWALQNGMTEQEVEYLTPEKVRKIEDHVHCAGAIFAKTDTSVDYREFTRALKTDAAAQGVEFVFGFKMLDWEQRNDGVALRPSSGAEPVEAAFVVNCAGGNAIDIAHRMGVGRQYTDLHFRGEYWEIAPEQASWIKTNIYSVPRHPELPFLDPHWIVRADGRREIGPNAVLVSGCNAYQGFCTTPWELVQKALERPLGNKMRLFTNPEFLRLASEEWMSSLSRRKMLSRVRRFIPLLSVAHLTRRGTAGIRSSVIDAAGNFMKEAIELNGPSSFHILNYNSPGATGSPAYTALVADKLIQSGALSHLKRRPAPLNGPWDFSEILEKVRS